MQGFQEVILQTGPRVTVKDLSKGHLKRTLPRNAGWLPLAAVTGHDALPAGASVTSVSSLAAPAVGAVRWGRSFS